MQPVGRGAVGDGVSRSRFSLVGAGADGTAMGECLEGKVGSDGVEQEGQWGHPVLPSS